MTAPAAGRNVRALLSVSDHVLCARGYSLANVIFVLTRDSVVVVDTAGTIRAARASLVDFRSITGCRSATSSTAISTVTTSVGLGSSTKPRRR